MNLLETNKRPFYSSRPSVPPTHNARKGTSGPGDVGLCEVRGATKVQPRWWGSYELFARLGGSAEATGGGIVYGLVGCLDPDRIRYVGLTTQPHERWAAHSRSIMAMLITRDGGGPVGMVVLERCEDSSSLAEAEQEWIRWCARRGDADMNTMAGKGRGPIVERKSRRRGARS